MSHKKQKKKKLLYCCDLTMIYEFRSGFVRIWRKVRFFGIVTTLNPYFTKKNRIVYVFRDYVYLLVNIMPFFIYTCIKKYVGIVNIDTCNKIKIKWSGEGNSRETILGLAIDLLPSFWCSAFVGGSSVGCLRSKVRD